jgi:hypothetical protein
MTEYPFVEYLSGMVVLTWLASKAYFKFHPALVLAAQFTAAMAWFQLCFMTGKPGELLYKNVLSCQALLMLLVGGLFLYFINTNNIKRIGRIIHVLAVASIPLNYFINHTDGYWLTAGLILNPAMNLGVCICTLPFLKGGKWAPWYVLAWLPISLYSSTSFAAYAAVWLAIILIVRPLQALFFIPLALASGYFFVDNFFGAERWQWYSFFWNEFNSKSIHWIAGLGVNHFPAIGPKLQVASTQPNEIWAFLHSDWFQILFEQGIIGFALWAWVAVTALYKSYLYHEELFVCGLSFSVIMLTYFPLHTSTGTLVAMLLLTPLAKTRLKLILESLLKECIHGRLY